MLADGPPQKGDIAQVLLKRYYTCDTALEKGFLEEYCFKALYGDDKEVFGGQPTNGGIMGIAPLGLMLPCDPNGAFAHTFAPEFSRRFTSSRFLYMRICPLLTL